MRHSPITGLELTDMAWVARLHDGEWELHDFNCECPRCANCLPDDEFEQWRSLDYKAGVTDALAYARLTLGREAFARGLAAASVVWALALVWLFLQR